MRHKQARIGCAESASYSGTQCLAPIGAKLLRVRSLSAAFLLCVTSRLVSVAACGKLFGHAVPCPIGAKLLRARSLSVLFLSCVTSRLGLVAACGKLFGHAVPCPAGAKLLRARQKRLKLVDFDRFFFVFCYRMVFVRIPSNLF